MLPPVTNKDCPIQRRLSNLPDRGLQEVLTSTESLVVDLVLLRCHLGEVLCLGRDLAKNEIIFLRVFCLADSLLLSEQQVLHVGPQLVVTVVVLLVFTRDHHLERNNELIFSKELDVTQCLLKAPQCLIVVSGL